MTRSRLRSCRDSDRLPNDIGEGLMTDTKDFREPERLVDHLFGWSEYRKVSPIVPGGLGVTQVSIVGPQTGKNLIFIR